MVINLPPVLCWRDLILSYLTLGQRESTCWVGFNDGYDHCTTAVPPSYSHLHFNRWIVDREIDYFITRAGMCGYILLLFYMLVVFCS